MTKPSTTAPVDEFTPAPATHACPKCGYCPHCGRGGQPWPVGPYPYWPWPYSPWTYPYYVTWQGANNAAGMSDSTTYSWNDTTGGGYGYSI